MKAAIINDRNKVIFTAHVEDGVKSIEVAGTVTADGYPVNRKSYRVSRSKRNLAVARACELVTKKSGTDALGHVCEFYS